MSSRPTRLIRLQESLYGALNVVKEPSMIRVEADELTYPLHILLRRAAVLTNMLPCVLETRAGGVPAAACLPVVPL